MTTILSNIPFIFLGFSLITNSPIVLIITILFLLIIMHNCSLHNFQASFKWWLINWIICHLCLLFLLFLCIKCNVRIEYLPLCDFSLDCITRGRFSWDTPLSNDPIFCLSLSGIIIKFISYGLFDSINIFWSIWILSFLISNCFLNECFLHFLIFLLYSCLIRFRLNYLSFKRKMNYCLIDQLICFILNWFK